MRFLAGIEVVDQPIAISMEICYVLLGGHELILLRSLLISIFYNLILKTSFHSCLFFDRLRVCCTFRCCFGYHDLILLLCILFFEFHFLNLLFEISNHHVHHGNYATDFLPPKEASGGGGGASFFIVVVCTVWDCKTSAY